jgi:hypothetical protein
LRGTYLISPEGTLKPSAKMVGKVHEALANDGNAG